MRGFREQPGGCSECVGDYLVGSISTRCQSVWPASILARSRMSLTSRVRRSVSCDDVQEFLSLFDGYVRIVVHDLAEGADRGERRPELVADGRDKVILHLVELFEAFVGGPELGRCRFQLLRLFLELAAVDDELGGLVEDLHDLVYIVHFLLQHGGDHDRAEAAPMAPASRRSA